MSLVCSRVPPVIGKEKGLATSYFPALLNAVSSPRRPFTVVFGMGTGVTSSLKSPVQKDGQVHRQTAGAGDSNASAPHGASAIALRGRRAPPSVSHPEGVRSGRRCCGHSPSPLSGMRCGILGGAIPLREWLETLCFCRGGPIGVREGPVRGETVVKPHG